MKNLNQSFIAFLLLTMSFVAMAKPEDTCPSAVVSFWKNYVQNTQDYRAVPVFLLTNSCMRAVGVSTDFHTAMINRFDHPENPKYVDQLYAQLDWGKSSDSLER